MNILVAGRTLQLLAQRAIYWPENQTLFVADVHLGKTDLFRHAGLPVPTMANEATLQRLSQLLASTKAQRLVILGDFWHGRAGINDGVIDAVSCWRAENRKIEIDLVLGNHDRGCLPFPDDWCFRIHHSPVPIAPFVASHFPDASEQGFTLAGHLHPAVTLYGRARQSLRLPCFGFRPGVGILPAFGEFTGVSNIEPDDFEQIYMIADHEVVQIPR